jgi:hypothetical protein
MRLLKDCRGAAAWAAAIALIPLIGAMALGAEAVLWQAMHQKTQHAADAAAYSAGLTLACQSSPPCSDNQSITARGQQTAALHGAWTNVTIDQPAQNQARAILTKHQRTVFAKLLGIADFDIVAATTAQVDVYGHPCVLALAGSVDVQGNLTASCGIASNNTSSGALSVSNPASIGFMTTVGGCSGCDGRVLMYAQPTTNPFAALDGTVNNLQLSNCPVTGSLTPYTSASRCTNNNFQTQSNKTYNLPAGAYVISGTLSITTGATINGNAGVTFILLPGAAVDANGTLNLTAPASTPAALPGGLDTNLFPHMVIYSASPVALQVDNSTITANGIIYAPAATVTFQGGTGSCNQIIAASVSLPGAATVDNSGCSTLQLPVASYVKLVQ